MRISWYTLCVDSEGGIDRANKQPRLAALTPSEVYVLTSGATQVATRSVAHRSAVWRVPTMRCSKCESENLTKWHRTAACRQRYQCRECKATSTDCPPSTLGPMRLPARPRRPGAVAAGRRVEHPVRGAGHRPPPDTITRLLVLAGQRCERCSTGSWRGRGQGRTGRRNLVLRRDEGEDEGRQGNHRSSGGRRLYLHRGRAPQQADPGLVARQRDIATTDAFIEQLEQRDRRSLPDHHRRDLYLPRFDRLPPRDPDRLRHASQTVRLARGRRSSGGIARRG